jgi:hypothetical protein
MADKYIPQVDYTSKDYASIRQDIIDLIPYYAPLWTNRDPADFGMVLIEAFAYMGDLLNYYIDRSANEAFIGTASQRSSILKIANLLGYLPTQSTAAVATLTFQNSSSVSVTVPALTQVATNTVSNGVNSQVIFETDKDVTVPAKIGTTNGTATVTCTQGVTVSDEHIGDSNGNINQQFTLLEYPVVNDSIDVMVNGVSYNQVEYLIDSAGYDPVFQASEDAEYLTSVQFGDNVSGRIPPNGSSIYATYRVGGGAIGNVAANTIKYIYKWGSSGEKPSGLTVSNQDVGPLSGAATGGADPESTDAIRTNAPKSIRALNRAVSLSDYASLAVQVSGVATANAVAEVYSSITIYFRPFGDSGLQSDNITASTVFNNLKATLTSYMVDKVPPGTSITFQPPSYVSVNMYLAIVVLPQYKQSQVLAKVNAALTDLFALDNVAFEDRINLSDVNAVLNEVEGLSRTQMYKLRRTDEEQNFTVTNKALTSNVATLPTSIAHSYKVGSTILVSNVDSTFNGTFVVTAVGTNTVSYAQIATNVTSIASSGTISALVVNDIVCASNEIPKQGTFTIDVTGGILS